MIKIQIKRGSKVNLPDLANGEYGITTDTDELFIGGSEGNLQIPLLGADGKLSDSYLPEMEIAGSGIPPRDLEAFSSQSTDDGIKLTFTPPKATYIPEHTEGDGKQFACMPAGVLFVYSETGYPRTPNDGTLAKDYRPVGDWTADQQEFEVTGLTKDVKYYFTAFPYSTEGVVNMNQTTANRTEMTYVDNTGSIAVTVQTPEGYSGTLGEYTITLVDQASDNPQNVVKQATGAGLTTFDGLVGGKQYKVRLSDTTDLLAPADSDVQTVVAGESVSVTVTYKKKVGTITVNVSTEPANMPIGQYTVTLTPQNGGAETLTKQGNGTQAVVFDNAIDGVTYTVSLSAINHYTANGNGTVTAVGGQNSLHNANYVFNNVSLESCSWSEIDTISQSDSASEVWSIGDTKNISVSGESLTLEIVGFNHDDLTNGGKAGITFGLKNCMEEPRAIDPDWEVDTFYGSPMETWLNGDLFNALPADLQAVIKPANKKTSDGIWYSKEENLQKRTIITNSMKVFLFSVVEIHGVELGTIPGEGVQYARFTNTESRNKSYPSDRTETGRVYVWWTRSPSNNSQGCFMDVRDGETLATGSPMPVYEEGVCFGFCV